MILDDISAERTLKDLKIEVVPSEGPTSVLRPPSYFAQTVEEPYLPPPSEVGSSKTTTYSPSTLSSPFDSKRTSLAQPLLLPPLYPPSSTSPFLFAYAPSLELAGVSGDAWFELINTINASVKTTPLLSVVRTTESVIHHLPGINWAVACCKQVIVGGFFFGIARGGAALAEGTMQGKIGLKIAKARTAAFGNINAPVPASTLALLDRANSADGLFPPSSGLLVTLVPSHLLPIILSQYPPLPSLPADVVSHLTRSVIKTSEAKPLLEVSMERKKALKVRSRIDFRRWGWLLLDDEQQRVAVARSSSPIGDLVSLAPSPPSSTAPRTLSNLSKAGLTAFFHLDEKLQARQSRKSLGGEGIAKRLGVDSTGRVRETRPVMGYELAEEKMGRGTVFLVVVRRGLVGLEVEEEF